MKSRTSAIISFEIARYFQHHLEAELKKSAALMDAVGFDGKTPRAINLSLLQQLDEEFPALRQADAVPYNFIEKWSKMNNVITYEEYSFDTFNNIFFERVLNLKYWNEEDSLKVYTQKLLGAFEKFDYRSRGFLPSMFLRFENNLREILREIVLLIDGIDHEKAWSILYVQSNETQIVINTFFEQILKEALDQSERLLHSILPAEIARELKETGKVEPVYIDSATVLFTDFVGFTLIAASMSPNNLIRQLDECFSIFDKIVDKYNLEKIKTIGDSYMCTGGVIKKIESHVLDSTMAALEMRDAISRLKKERAKDSQPYWDIRIGLHTGPLIAGVIGKKKFIFDVWGDTVNIASRMESSGEGGRVNVSHSTYEIIKPFFDCEPRGKIEVKNKGEIYMYFVNGVNKQG